MGNKRAIKKITSFVMMVVLCFALTTIPSLMAKADDDQKILYTFEKGTTMGWSVVNTADKGGAFDTSAKAPVEFSEDLKQEGNRGSIKINANFTGKDWDDASIIADFGTGKDVSLYDTLDYDILLPSSFAGQLKLGSAGVTSSWAWIDDVFADNYSGVDLTKGEKITINGKEYNKFHMTRLKTKAFDNLSDKTFLRFVIKVATTTTTYKGPIYIDNIALSKGGYIPDVNGTGTAGATRKADITVQAEQGLLIGVEAAEDGTTSGGAFVQGFDNSGDTLKVTAEIQISGTYAVILKYKTFGGDKTNTLYLNGEKIKDYTFKDTATWKEVVIGQYYLEPGNNTFTISSSWGWIGVDYIRFVGGDGKQVSTVSLSMDSASAQACDMPITFSALADDAAEYRFLVRKAGGQWEDISKYSNSLSCVWVPGTAGEYEVKVYARGSATTVDKQAEKSIKYTALSSYVNKPLVNQMFGNGMVLQRDVNNAIWGWDKPKTKIKVAIGKKTFTGVANENGEWKVNIGKFSAGGPYNITVSDSTNSKKITDVLFGDVWLCSGQSNMEFTLSRAMNASKEIKDSNYPKIRYFKVPTKTSPVPLTTIDNAGGWKTCSPSTSGELSAVAYFFARKLNKDLNIPIGIVFSAAGGTKAESWTSYDSLNTIADYEKSSYAIKTGATDIDISTSPNALYNGMISPVIPYKLKGVLWYQGESNWGELGYNKLLNTLIADWRMNFGMKNLPFLLVQISAFGTIQSVDNPVQTISGLPEIREAQLSTMLKDKNVGLVVTTDVGTPADIHPTNKQDVGARAAICALGKFYGMKIVYSGPIYKSMSIEGSKAMITFDSIGSGLMVGLKVGLDPVKEVENGKLTGFAIAGSDHVFYTADAEINGNTVIVSSSMVKDPVAVRYGWFDSPVINLYNKDGLQASPFRTDIISAFN